MKGTLVEANAADSSLDGANRCRLSAAAASRLEKDTGSHVRIDGPVRGAYFIVDTIQDAQSAAVAVESDGWKRVGVTPGGSVELHQTIPSGGYMTAWPRGGFAETLWGGMDGGILISCPHGGDIEFGTDDIGARVFKRLRTEGVQATAWLCHGFNSGVSADAFDRWHIKKPVKAADAYPELTKLLDHRFEHVIGIHMHSYDYVAVGGQANHATRKTVAEALRAELPADFEVRTEYSELHLDGRSDMSSVNYFCNGGGVQIELPPFVCYKYRKRVAEALQDVYTQ